MTPTAEEPPIIPIPENEVPLLSNHKEINGKKPPKAKPAPKDEIKIGKIGPNSGTGFLKSKIRFLYKIIQ